MEFAIGLFFIVLREVFKRYWGFVCIPIFAMVVHGVYTGTWYFWSSIIISIFIAVAAALQVLRNYPR